MADVRRRGGKPGERIERVTLRIVSACFLALAAYVGYAVGPTEGNLECIVEIGDRAVTANQQSPPDHGTDASQKDA